MDTDSEGNDNDVEGSDKHDGNESTGKDELASESDDDDGDGCSSNSDDLDLGYASF
jgi:hypothetical protein